MSFGVRIGHVAGNSTYGICLKCVGSCVTRVYANHDGLLTWPSKARSGILIGEHIAYAVTVFPAIPNLLASIDDKVGDTESAKPRADA